MSGKKNLHEGNILYFSLKVCKKTGTKKVSYFKTLSIGLVRGIGLSTSRSAGQRCMTDSMSSVTVKNIKKKKIYLCLQGAKS